MSGPSGETSSGELVHDPSLAHPFVAPDEQRRTAEHYRLLFERNPLPMWVFDRETFAFLAVNDAAVNHYGYSREEFLRMTLRDIRPAESLPELYRIASEAPVGRVGPILTQHRKKNGQLIEVEITADAIDFGGRPARLVLARDLTQQREAERALHASNERFRMIARAAGDVLWDHDLVSGVRWWSDSLETQFGYSPREQNLDDQWWLEHIHPNDRERIDESIQKALNSKAERWDGSYRFLRRDGTYAYVQDRGYIIRDAQGRAIRLIGVAIDETERHLAREKIAEQAALLDEAQDAIVLKDLEDRIRYWNKGAERLYGWSGAEALGRLASDLLYRDRVQFDTAMRNVLKEGVWTGEVAQRTQHGRDIIVEARWTLIRDTNGRPKSILAINTDVTERKRLEAQFLRAQRLESIGTLASGIAHDFNNVLAPMVMALALLRLKSSDPDFQRMIDLLEASAQRGASLVKQVLAFGRGADGERVPLNPKHIAREIQQIIQDTFPKSIEFELNCSPELAEIVSDPTQLHQVMLNLCVNARDAMPRGGRIVLELDNVTLDKATAATMPSARPGHYVRLRVQDTGTGIPPELREKIFEPFFTTKPKDKGSGLGLATVLAIARSHTGFVHLTSEVGVGTSFEVYFPAAPKPVADAAQTDSALFVPRGNGELILVVDDEAPIREVARHALESFNYRVSLASHGAEAVSRYAHHPHSFSAVVLDLAMPVMDGNATVAALRSISPTLPIILTTGTSDTATYTQLPPDAQPTETLNKPYTAESLAHALHRVLRARTN